MPKSVSPKELTDKIIRTDQKKKKNNCAAYFSVGSDKIFKINPNEQFNKSKKISTCISVDP